MKKREGLSIVLNPSLFVLAELYDGSRSPRLSALTR